MNTVTAKLLHDKTGQCLDRVRRGERLVIVRDGEHDALLVPTTEAIDPAWPEIMAQVWAAQEETLTSRPNPILQERQKRHHAAHLR